MVIVMFVAVSVEPFTEKMCSLNRANCPHEKLAKILTRLHRPLLRLLAVLTRSRNSLVNV
jgi:hypothetical protein